MGFILIMIMNLFIYAIVQPIAYIRLFQLLRKKKDLEYINNFLRSISIFPFSTLILFIIFELFGGRIAITLFFMPFSEFEFSIDFFSSVFLLYSWLLSAGYFVIYFFNKNNKLGVYIYKLLFIMFVFVLFATGYHYLKQ